MTAPPPVLARCKSCKAQIIWVKTSNGRNAPVDAHPESRMVWDPVSGLYAVRETFVSHFATCPNADTHRAPKGGANGR